MWQTRNALSEELDALERAWLQRRGQNCMTLERYAAKHGPHAPPPKLRKPPAHELARRITLLAELSVARVCQSPLALADPAVLRRNLKAARDTVGEADLYESELKAFLRAKNKAIGWLLIDLEQYLGPDPGPSASWGRSSEPPQGDAYEAALNERCGFHRRVLLGAPPPDPEFAPDAVAKAYERFMVKHVNQWLPSAVQVAAIRKQGSVDGFNGDMLTLLSNLRHLIVETLGRKAHRNQNLDDLRSRVRKLRDDAPKTPSPIADAIYRRAWCIVCDEILEILNAGHVAQSMRREQEERAA